MKQIRIKSKKYQGVYREATASGDITFSITYKDLSNQTRRKVIGKKSGGITEVFAYNERMKILNELRLGVDPMEAKKKKKDLQFITVWKYYLDNKGMKESTRDDYAGRWDKHMKHYFSESVTIVKLKSFRRKMKSLDKPLSPRSIHLMESVMGSAIKYWNTRPEHINMQIADTIAILRADDKDHLSKQEKAAKSVKRERFFSQDEVNLLKANITGELLLFVLISLSTGARLGTVMEIRKKHISGSKVTLINEKAGGNTYTGWLDEETQECLMQVLSDLKVDDKIFKLSKAAIQKRLQRKINNLFNVGLDTDDRVNRAVVHTLRHTVASHLVMNGVPLVAVKKLLDHAEIDTTMRYAHLAPEHGKDAVMELWK